MKQPMNLSEAADALRSPFPAGEEQYRAGPCWERDGERYTRPLAFIDARAVFERLDEVVGPDNWSTHLERLAPGVYLCRLTILGVTRADVGMAGGSESEIEKAGASDAVKRAAVQHGIGRYLYGLELPPVKLERRGSDWVLPKGWRPSTRAAAQEPEPATKILNLPSSCLATGRQIAKISAELRRIGWDEAHGRQFLEEHFGKKTRRELSVAEASRCIDMLAEKPGAHTGSS
ncbi:MAG TPA: Rad52/Rad22 family DNA repair protein [Oscillatoriaceae cyanobacterium]